MQPKLLRALQERRVRPVGGATRSVRRAHRGATNRDLEAEVEEGRFREDLFFRVDVLRVEVPPLRARGSDVLLLAQRFLERFAARLGKQVSGLSTPAAERLLAYDWPGNVRELENCMERAVALAEHEQVIVEDLPERIRDYRAGDLVIASHDPSELVPLEAVERVYILRVLDAVGGNKTLAARILGLDRKTLYRKLTRCSWRTTPRCAACWPPRCAATATS
jgi:DNA-binding NtrC family response regulator